MQAHFGLNGCTTQKKNYVWGGALTLAWKGLVENIIKQNIQIQSEDPVALRTTDNYNNCPFNASMMDAASFYARAGYGNDTVKLINKEVVEKFPGKTTPKLQQTLTPSCIISYAYFLKNLKFQHPFSPVDIHFNYNEIVPGFQAKTKQHKSQIKVHEHTNDQNFVIELKTTCDKDQIFIIKNQKDIKPEDVVERVGKFKESVDTLGRDQVFKMPKVGLRCKRDVSELKGVFLKNQAFKQYFFSQFYEIINLDIDEAGVKVENEGVIVMTRCAVMRHGRRFILDSPFWIVIREGLNHPYFIAHINNVNDK